jgi:hypothetical protein
MAMKLSIKTGAIAAAHPKVKEAVDAFHAAMKVATDAKKALAVALKDTPEWRLLAGAAGEPSIVVGPYGDVRLIARYHPEYEPAADTLAPQTLNALITGKLLTDEEKRVLLETQGIRLTKPEPRKPDANDDLLNVSDFDSEIPF